MSRLSIQESDEKISFCIFEYFYCIFPQPQVWSQQSEWNKVRAKCFDAFKFNPLRAKFFRGNINIYLHFVSFLHIDTTQVVEILPQIRQELTYST